MIALVDSHLYLPARARDPSLIAYKNTTCSTLTSVNVSVSGAKLVARPDLSQTSDLNFIIIDL